MILPGADGARGAQRQIRRGPAEGGGLARLRGFGRARASRSEGGFKDLLGVLSASPVGDGSALLLAVAKYYGADGKAINENGVTPSVVQPATAEADNGDEENQPGEPEQFGGKDDLQLRKAIEILGQPATPAKAA